MSKQFIGGHTVNAIETLNALNCAYQVMVAEVREEYGRQGIDAMARLMKRVQMSSPEDAILEEARQRVRRNKWASVTRDSTNKTPGMVDE